jgi:hypothetical protein
MHRDRKQNHAGALPAVRVRRQARQIWHCYRRGGISAHRDGGIDAARLRARRLAHLYLNVTPRRRVAYGVAWRFCRTYAKQQPASGSIKLKMQSCGALKYRRIEKRRRNNEKQHLAMAAYQRENNRNEENG